MKKTKRQTIRKTLLLISFLLFPITIWYFSPYLIIQAASEHIINGSFIVFVLMLVLSMFFGRAWCGYLCPAGGLQECAMRIKDTPAPQGKRDKIKYVIWVVWIAAVIVTFILGKNDVTVNPFYMTDHGISVSGIYNYVIYYGVILLLVVPPLVHGKRATCHYICWMAPFMVIGSSIERFLHLPQLHVEADKSKCVSCGMCSKACPMGLDVKKMVADGTGPKCTECIQCGACVDECPKKVLKYKLLWR
ncbi:4Fe-4S binding protein [Butyrivibrio sp. CB08]|uniref:4Fe-4S binding protein n=1 Tax=Butyrivibrio sp. CB08 TaxID=2364879 RepID=UPI000EAA4497|nr:4Fe-4S binding protein [Butyrivibrio sp. CB08]RKM61241.1 4Fe-4S binding protein [Butyrivibrio sp. CB08]